ncbi:2'-5' RNA ligase family protein [Candidatus Saccharibacteria bacterium]|nr:2'-5' RNA ligase family protein [Candidatus Saccharibacteria bacterium]
MNGKKADKARYWVVYLPKGLPVGTTFKPNILHLTIVPWFVTSKDEDYILDSFKNVFSGGPAFEITLGQSDVFKHKRSIPINLIKPSQQLLALHTKTLDWLATLQAHWAVNRPHVAEEYKPHIRRRPGYNLSYGAKLRIDSLSLVKAYRRGDDFRIVASKVSFS